jgi:hypothetical protein
MTLKTTQKFMTSNDCYKAGRTITPKGLMVHSTATPGVMAARWFDLWNKAGIEKGVHGFLDNKEFYQYLPWNRRGWHAGGAANNTHIGVEWCEPKDLNDKAYLDEIWVNGVELYASLCKQFNLTEKDIIAHYEGYKLGIASNHGDPAHWWKLHGKTMDMFRSDVGQALKGVKNGWKQESGSWYFYKDGKKKTGWLQDKGKWYYLNPNGDMRLGWVQDKDKWYFLDLKNGDMKTGWIMDKNKWYYLDEKGVMKTGRITLAKGDYFLQSNGALIITDKDGVITNG